MDKLFRFVESDAWFGRHGAFDETRELRALCWYSEPFNAECRAFGRLQETGREALALKCFGYVLLTEENERDITERFLGFNETTGTEVHFNGHGSETAFPTDFLDLRSLFPTTGGRPPPLRGILKTFGEEDDQLRPAKARQLLNNIVKLHQLGIFFVDVSMRQYTNVKIAHFSTAFTIPHFLSNPELNAQITTEQMTLMEESVFEFAYLDYFEFDTMIEEWNEKCKNPTRRVAVWAFPEQHVEHTYSSRRPQQACRLWTYVDLRPRARIHKKPVKKGNTTRRNLPSNPPRWYCGEELGKILIRSRGQRGYRLGWEIKEGLMFPERRRHM